mmetsp:Transcript_11176/g.23496  ORF Transcript_11176/g.23496 Transcript_11176/m.23496 type:complete len:93 (-) Transcript_11176:47-325(-)
MPCDICLQVKSKDGDSVLTLVGQCCVEHDTIVCLPLDQLRAQTCQSSAAPGFSVSLWSLRGLDSEACRALPLMRDSRACMKYTRRESTSACA